MATELQIRCSSAASPSSFFNVSVTRRLCRSLMGRGQYFEG